MTDFIVDTEPTFVVEDDPSIQEDLDGAVVATKKTEDRQFVELTDVPDYLKKSYIGMYVDPEAEEDLVPMAARSYVVDGINNSTSPEDISKAMEKSAVISEALKDVENISVGNWADMNDPLVSASKLRFELRKNKATNILTNKLEEYSGGSVSEFIDAVVYDTWSGIVDIVDNATDGTRLDRLSEEWAVALTSYNDEELDAFVKERLEYLKDGGVLPNFILGETPEYMNNSYLVARELEAIHLAGAQVSTEALGQLTSAIGVFDVATLGGLAVVKGAAKFGKSVISRLRSSGSTIATEAAMSTELVIRGGLHVVEGEVLDAQRALTKGQHSFETQGPRRASSSSRIADDVVDAEILDDILPDGLQSRMRDTTVPPVNSGAILSRLAGNWFIKNHFEASKRFTFGAVDPDRIKNWVEKQGRVMAQANSSRILNYDVVSGIEEGLEVSVAKLFLGKDTGKPFKYYNEALSLSNKIPNSKVIDMRSNRFITAETGSGEFAVVTEQGIPVRELVDPLPLENITLRNMFMKYIGRSGFGADVKGSNLADNALFGGQKIKKDIESTIKKSLTGLPEEDVQAINSIITTLRDTPSSHASAKTWFPEEDFIQNFAILTGREPSVEAINAYTTLANMSDYSWWVAASTRLTGLINQGAIVVRIGADDVIAVRTQTTVNSLREKGTRHVWDAQKNEKVLVSDLAPETKLYSLSQTVDRGIGFVVNFSDNTRRPTLVDAYPYNPGGTRINEGITWYVGGDDNGRWATLIGARSREHAEKARDQFARVSKELNKVTTDEKGLSGLTRAQKDELTALVQANKDWNRSIETIEDWVEFAKSRGVSITTVPSARLSGEKLANIVTDDETIKSLTAGQHIAYHRHDINLLEFGGEKATNRDPLIAIHQQTLHAVSRGAQMKYRMEAPTSWVKKVEDLMERSKEGEVTFRTKEGEQAIAVENLDFGMTDEMKVLNWKIKGETTIAKKLRQEQAVINRRLNQVKWSQSASPTNPIYAGIDKSTARVAEIFWNSGLAETKAGSALSFIGSRLNTRSALTAGFLLKMTDISQLAMQGSFVHLALIPMVPKSGFKAAGLASIARQAAREGTPGLFDEAWNAATSVAGLSRLEADALKSDILHSGRGYMRGALSEDPEARMVLGSKWDKTKHIVSTPFYVGENYAQTSSRIASFLEIRRLHPELSMDSPTFWNLVTEKDRGLSLGLARSQSSAIQEDRFAAFLYQWTSWQLSVTEHVLSPLSPLSKGERLRLGLAQTLLWGVGGTGVFHFFPELENDLRANGVFGKFIANGADEIFDPILGIRPGERLSLKPLELLDKALIFTSSPSEYAPSGKIVGDVLYDANTMAQDLLYGRDSLLSYDVARLARNWRALDSAVMGYTMLMQGSRTNRTGTKTIESDFSVTESVLQALGVTPAEVIEMSKGSTLLYSDKKKRDSATEHMVRLAKALKDAETPEQSSNVLQDMALTLDVYELHGVRRREVLQKALTRAGAEYDLAYITLELAKSGKDNNY